jgi:hypothetical protein
VRGVRRTHNKQHLIAVFVRLAPASEPEAQGARDAPPLRGYIGRGVADFSRGLVICAHNTSAMTTTHNTYVHNADKELLLTMSRHEPGPRVVAAENSEKRPASW